MKRYLIPAALAALALAAPATASASTTKSCRYGTDAYGAPVVKRLRIQNGYCVWAENVALNVVADYWENGMRLHRHPESEGAVCTYRGDAYVKRARCTYARRIVITFRLRFPV